MSATSDQVIAYASTELGKPYVYGDEGPSDFDCSGLMQWVFAHVGIQLPRTADQQYHATKPVTSPASGDLVFYVDSQTGKASHVALYIGGGKMIEAPHSGADVRIHSVYDLAGHTRTYGRVAGLSGLAPLVATTTAAASTATTTVTSWFSALDPSTWAGDIREITLEAAAGILGLVLIVVGIKTAAGHRGDAGGE